MKWTLIAKHFDVSTKTLQRWCKQSGFVDPLARIDDAGQLDQIVHNFAVGNARRGQRMTIGHLRHLQFRVPRQQVRDSIDRVDHDGKEQRKIKRIVRRVYTVPGPLHLYHCDGHHKLVKYGIVTMGCIDGFTRYIPYLCAVTNNRSSTALRLFRRGCEQFGLPSRVRGDRGGENVKIADLMIAHRGPHRGSYIAGPSRFNTRIERLWRDVRSHTIQYYKELFESLERDGLDVDNEVHLYALQYMFVGRINEDLELFRGGWNEHAIRTEHNQTPMQLMFLHSNLAPPPMFLPPVNGDDEDGDEDEEQAVHVEPAVCPLDEAGVAELRLRRPPLTMADEAGTLINKYMHALEVTIEILNR